MRLTTKPQGAPDWAQAKGRLYLATFWMQEDADGMPVLEGINWFHEKILLPFSVFFHNHFIAPFQPGIKGVPPAGFPIYILEVYDPDFGMESDVDEDDFL